MNLHEALLKYFGFHTFRKGQEEVITSLLSGQHTLAVLPTGTGKSLCYQLPGYLLQGTVIIVSPLLSLMQDQVEQLKFNGEKRVIALNSFLSSKERQKIFHTLHNYRFVYISPEMLTNRILLQRLKKLEVSLFVVDEAHCISQWGYDFRPDYLRLKEVRSILGNPITLALTATATEEVRHDIIQQLDLNEVNQIIYSVDRPNISFVIEEMTRYEEKINRLIHLVRELNKPGIIYFSSKRVSEEVAELLRNNGIVNVAAYHGGMDQEQRILIQQQFLHDQLQVICATSAFGMGVNKENIRFVIHFHMPYQIESYLQEIGRAGRDGENSIAILLYMPGDELIPLQMFENELPTDDQIEQFYKGNLDGSQDLSTLTLSDIQIRFLTYYKEIAETNNEVIIKVKSIRDKRIQYKQMKLMEMKKWLKSTSCRRTLILEYFNEEYYTQVNNCCDICGITLEDFTSNEPNAVNIDKENWQIRLRKLLLRGDVE